MKKYQDLIKAMKEINNYSYPGDDCKGSIKRQYKTKARALFNELAKDLGLKEFKYSFNPAGPAVTGDPSLYGMWSENEGIAIYPTFNVFGQGIHFMYRRISHMKDYRGESNQWIHKAEDCSYEEVVRILSRLKPKKTPVINSSLEEELEKEPIIQESESLSSYFMFLFLNNCELESSHSLNNEDCLCRSL